VSSAYRSFSGRVAEILQRRHGGVALDLQTDAGEAFDRVTAAGARVEGVRRGALVAPMRHGGLAIVARCATSTGA
jgi:hypothetical protein